MTTKTKRKPKRVEIQALVGRSASDVVVHAGGWLRVVEPLPHGYRRNTEADRFAHLVEVRPEDAAELKAKDRVIRAAKRYAKAVDTYGSVAGAHKCWKEGGRELYRATIEVMQRKR